jgi:hypothetical protein
MHNQIDYILIDKRGHSSVVDVQAFKDADSVTDFYLVVAKFGEKLLEGNEQPASLIRKDKI